MLFLSFFFGRFRAIPTTYEVSKLGVESELKLLAYGTATATAMQDLRHVCDLHRSSQQCWILKPPNKARDLTHILMDTSQVCFH